jgi:hypothetical protein
MWVTWANRDDVGLLDVATGERWLREAEHPPRPERVFLASEHPWIYYRNRLRGGTLSWGRFQPDPERAGDLTAETVSGLGPNDLAVALAPDDSRIAILVGDDSDEDSLALDIADVTDEGVLTDRRTVSEIRTPAEPMRRSRPVPGVSVPVVSWSPSGQSTLVDANGSVYYYDVDEGTGLRVLTDPLVDPDAGGALVPVVDSVSLLGDDTVVFAAWCEGWPPERGSRIYSCKLDASDLKRLTPLDDDPIPRYIIPATGEPAFKMPWEE